MIKQICVFLFLVAACIAMAGQTDDPTLVAVNLPMYPPLAVQARVEGVVRITFTLPPNSGQPTNIEIVSGHPMLKNAAAENVKTWKFENPYTAERKYETTFMYTLSGREVPLPKKPIVTFDSYHQIKLVSDIAAPTVNY
jgi:TonB family protein